MPEPFRHCGHIDAVRNEQGCVCVPQDMYRAVEQIVMLNEAISQFYFTNNPPEAARKPP